MMKKCEKSEKGFSLVELMIVLVIIGVLVTIAVPQFNAARTKSFETAAQSDLRSVASAMETDFLENNAYSSLNLTYDDDTPLELDDGTTINISNDVTIRLRSTNAAWGAASEHNQGDEVWAATSADPTIRIVDGHDKTPGSASTNVTVLETGVSASSEES